MRLRELKKLEGKKCCVYFRPLKFPGFSGSTMLIGDIVRYPLAIYISVFFGVKGYNELIQLYPGNRYKHILQIFNLEE